jgi:hypothetical protein
MNKFDDTYSFITIDAFDTALWRDDYIGKNNQRIPQLENIFPLSIINPRGQALVGVCFRKLLAGNQITTGASPVGKNESRGDPGLMGLSYYHRQ